GALLSLSLPSLPRFFFFSIGFVHLSSSPSSSIYTIFFFFFFFPSRTSHYSTEESRRARREGGGGGGVVVVLLVFHYWRTEQGRFPSLSPSSPSQSPLPILSPSDPVFSGVGTPRPSPLSVICCFLSDPSPSAMAAACRRALMLSGYSSRTVAGLASGLGAGSSVARGSSPCSSSAFRGPDFHHGRSGYARHVSQMILKSSGKRAFLVDTLALVRKLEAQGIPSKHAEAITSAITEVLNDSLENVAQSFMSQGELQKEHHFSTLQRETEKLKSDIEKLRSELKSVIDMVNRLDLNLERGRTRDELAKQSSGTSELTNKLDREIHALRAQLEAAKYDVIKYCIGSLVSLTAVGLAVVRILL
ncbi:hypothetical protein Taro_025511, partial [Colocasia esculenta]|nr:hypothetical protein [Colocasia esculenta]